MQLSNEIALVTGASRGIGLAIALELGRQGAIVIGTATSTDGADRISTTFQENGIKGRGAALNITDQHAIDALVSSEPTVHDRRYVHVGNLAVGSPVVAGMRAHPPRLATYRGGGG